MGNQVQKEKKKRNRPESGSNSRNQPLFYIEEMSMCKHVWAHLSG